MLRLKLIGFFMPILTEKKEKKLSKSTLFIDKNRKKDGLKTGQQAACRDSDERKGQSGLLLTYTHTHTHTHTTHTHLRRQLNDYRVRGEKHCTCACVCVCRMQIFLKYQK